MTTSFRWDQFMIQTSKFYVSEEKLNFIKEKKFQKNRKKNHKPNVGIFGWNDDVERFIKRFIKSDWNITVYDDDVETLEYVWRSTGGKYFNDYGRNLENFVDHLYSPTVNLDNEQLGRGSVVILCVPYEKYLKELRPLLSPGGIVFDYYGKKCYLLQNDTFDVQIPFNAINFIVKED